MGNCLFFMAATEECRMGNSIDQPKLDVPELLKRHGLRPDKRLGQNFLIDPIYLNRVVEAGFITREDIVLEIGAGLGNLTSLLATLSKEVLAVELDPDLIPILKNVVSPYQNIRIIQGDILKFDLTDLIHSAEFLVVANIPYYITSNLIRHLTSGENRPRRIVLTIQKEVADRICALPGKLSLLGLSVQIFGNPVIVSRIPAGAFYPVPNVDSTILRVDLFPSPFIPEDLLGIFFKLAKAGFSQKRKTLRNSLSAGLRLDKTTIEALLAEAEIEARRRAETLNLEEWKLLTIIYSDLVSP
jgi:16S rRNA (adenine1518-N6/adenine1519-N6)-dimethyltransferase